MPSEGAPLLEQVLYHTPQMPCSCLRQYALFILQASLCRPSQHAVMAALSCIVKAVHDPSWQCFMHAGGQEYKIHNAEVLFREDADMDDLIDVIEGNRRYTRCLYVYNKIDVCSIEEVCASPLCHRSGAASSQDMT